MINQASVSLRSALFFNIVLIALIPLLYEALTIPVIIMGGLLLLMQSLLMSKTYWVMKSVKHNTLVKNLGAIVFSSIIAVEAKPIGLLNAMVNLLYAGVLLWLVTADLNSTPNDNRRKQRHWAHNVFALCLMLIAVSFIYQQSLQWTLYAVILLIALLCALYVNQISLNVRSHFLPSFLPPYLISMVLSCAILAGITFVVLPTLTPFWKLPQQKQTATGLSDEMTPGDVANLAQSSRLAFRVSIFSDDPMGSDNTESNLLTNHAAQYWRVLTLEEFNGKTWRQSPIRTYTRRNNPAASITGDLSTELIRLSGANGAGAATDTATTVLSIIAEPSYQPWLLSFGTSIPQPTSALGNKAIFTNDSRITSREKLVKRAKYDAKVIANSNVLPLSNVDRRLNVSVPSTGLVKTRELVSQFALNTETHEAESSVSIGHSEQKIAAFNHQVLQYFAAQGFKYTLTPPTLSGDHIDSFLFESKQGFCAHYASAHAVMLRLVGVPARVVTGYHGGEYNPNGQYLNVYDSSAHAWVEYYSPNQGWLRIDPTGAVSPTRISQGLEASLDTTGETATDAIGFVKQSPWLNQLRQQFQSLDYYWTVWVLDFDNNKRENFNIGVLSTLFNSKSLYYLLFGFIMVCVIATVAYWLWRNATRPKLSVQRQIIIKLYREVQSRSAESSHKENNNIDWTQSLHWHQQHLCELSPKNRTKIIRVVELLNQSTYSADYSINKKSLCHLIETFQ